MKDTNHSIRQEVIKSIIQFYKYNLVLVAVLLPLYYYGLRNYQYDLTIISLILFIIGSFINLILNYTKCIQSLKKYLQEQYPEISNQKIRFVGFLLLSPVSTTLVLYQLLFNNKTSSKPPFLFNYFKSTITIIILMNLFAPFLLKHSQVLSTPTISYIGKSYQDVNSIFEKKSARNFKVKIFLENFDSLSTIELPLVMAISLSDLSKQKEIDKTKMSKSELQKTYIIKLYNLIDKGLELLSPKPYLLTVNPLILLYPPGLIESSLLGGVDLILQAKIEAEFVKKVNDSINEMNKKLNQLGLNEVEMKKFKDQVDAYQVMRKEFKYMKRVSAYEQSLLSKI